MPSSIAQSSTEVHSAPDWEMKPMCPLVGVAAAKLAFRLMPGTMMPRQFGPRIRMPSNFRCSLPNMLFELAALRPDLAEAGRDDDDAAGARLAAFAHQLRARSRPACRSPPGPAVREIRDAAERRQAVDRRAFRIDGVDHPANPEPIRLRSTVFRRWPAYRSRRSRPRDAERRCASDYGSACGTPGFIRLYKSNGLSTSSTRLAAGSETACRAVMSGKFVEFRAGEGRDVAQAVGREGADETGGAGEFLERGFAAASAERRSRPERRRSPGCARTQNCKAQVCASV